MCWWKPVLVLFVVALASVAQADSTTPEPKTYEDPEEHAEPTEDGDEYPGSESAPHDDAHIYEEGDVVAPENAHEGIDAEEDQEVEVDDSAVEEEDPTPKALEEAPLVPELDQEKVKVLHAKIDADNDGKISKAEIIAFDKATRMHIAASTLDADFDGLNLDGDGLSVGELHIGQQTADDLEGMSEEEVKASKMEQISLRAKFNIADRDGDGSIAKDEFMHFVHPDFNPEVLELTVASLVKIRDTDGDGLLTIQEFYGASGNQGIRGTQGGDHENDHEDYTWHLEEFKKHDLDGDGKLDPAEVEAYETPTLLHHSDIANIIKHADKDGDSLLSHEELNGHLDKLSTDARDGLEALIIHAEL